ncbi:hypothetical protein K449DRAFT_410178 [Hypoxylon sp. EC38]|nr:hypothetical protein K449DRAFT_410178 [Hypoxylon sp. EC38]
MVILDDYLNIANPHFSYIPASQLSITVSNNSAPPPPPPKKNAASDQQAIIDQLKPFTVISSMRKRTSFPSTLLRQLPNLKLLLAIGTQFGTFDLAGTSDLRISRAGPRAPHSTLILALARTVAFDDAAMKGPAKGWQSRLGLGVVGLGAHRSENLTQEKAEGPECGGGGASVYGVNPVDREVPTFAVVFATADVRSRGIVRAGELVLMKRSAVLVNMSRGPFIDDAGALGKGRIRGAALDLNSPWRSTIWSTQGISNLIITPHMGTAENVGRWLRGERLLHRLNWYL